MIGQRNVSSGEGCLVAGPSPQSSTVPPATAAMDSHTQGGADDVTPAKPLGLPRELALSTLVFVLSWSGRESQSGHRASHSISTWRDLGHIISLPFNHSIAMTRFETHRPPIGARRPRDPSATLIYPFTPDILPTPLARIALRAARFIA